MNELREEMELPPLEHSQQDIERACGRLYERYYGKDESDMRRDIASLERQLKSSLAANREQKAEIERLTQSLDHTLTYGNFNHEPLPAPESMTDEQLDEAWEYGGDKCKCWHCHWFRYIMRLRASVGEKPEDAELGKLRALLTQIKIQTESNQLVNESILRRIKEVAPTLPGEEK